MRVDGKGVVMYIKKHASLVFAFILFSLFGTALFCACKGKNAAEPVQEAAKELRFGFTTEPATLDPLSPSNTADGRSILFNVFEGLVKPDTEGGLLPALAESWTIAQGGLVYDFKLREGVVFHDGSILNSADVKFTLETAIAARFAGFTQIESVETQGDYAVRVTLKAPDPEFLPYITIGIVKAGAAEKDRETRAVGTGPFFIESYTVQQSLVLRKFPDYRQKDLPKLEKVTVVFLADSDALLLGLQGGSIDGASITGALAQQLDPKRFDIIPGYSATVQLLALNNKTPGLDDIRMRKALSYGVDIQEIIDTAFYGQGRPSGSPLIPGLSVYYEDSLANPYPADIEKAKALLAEAGYGEGGRKFSLEITVASNYTMHVDTAQVIVGQLAKIGVNARIKLIDWATWLSDVYRDRNYQATIISLDANNVSPRSFLSRYRSDGGSNFINFKNADFDRAYDEVLLESDEARRIELYRELQRVISKNAASVYIQDILGFKAFRGGAFSGVQNYPLYVIDFASIYGVSR
jgi:peptide/nickel transport system substrate-binding protein